MKKFVTQQIETFLLAIDKNLSAKFEIIIIGGAAAALAYKVVEYTKDIKLRQNLEDAGPRIPDLIQKHS